MKDTPQKPPIGVKAPEAIVRHDAQGKGILSWAAETARHLALTTSTVLRRLDHKGLAIDDTAPRGKPSSRASELPGGGFNPYESRPRLDRGARGSSTRSAPPSRPAPPTGGAGRGARRAAAARTSWWQRLLGRR